MRLGILGGTFNPIHIAHLRCAEEAREALHLDHVLFIPTAAPPHKEGHSLAPAADRLAMVRLALQGNKHMEVSPIEIERPGRSYSVDTLRELRNAHPPPNRIVFLLGLDAFREIETWKEYESLFTLADFAVLSRPPGNVTPTLQSLPVAVRRQFCYSEAGQALAHESGTRVFFLTVTALDISASAIRRHVRRGRSIRYLVPEAVERYIRMHRLYDTPGRPDGK